MPVLLLPLYNCLTRMKFIHLNGKFNILSYLIVVFIIVMYPFIYAMRGLRIKVKKENKKLIKTNKNIKKNLDKKKDLNKNKNN